MVNNADYGDVNAC